MKNGDPPGTKKLIARNRHVVLTAEEAVLTT